MAQLKDSIVKVSNFYFYTITNKATFSGNLKKDLKMVFVHFVLTGIKYKTTIKSTFIKISHTTVDSIILGTKEDS